MGKHGGLHLKAGARQYVFNLTVAPPAPPVVRIIGPSSVSDACSFRILAVLMLNVIPGLKPYAVCFWRSVHSRFYYYVGHAPRVY